jgi:hypothetical protein
MKARMQAFIADFSAYRMDRGAVGGRGFSLTPGEADGAEVIFDNYTVSSPAGTIEG